MVLNIARICFVTALLLPLSAFATAHDNCSAIVTSAQEAADKADWILEADVADILQLGADNHIEVSIEKATMLHERQKSPRFFTAVLLVDSCFPDSKGFVGKAGSQLIGKRMRFFGTRLEAGRGRVLFYMQPAQQAMPAWQQSPTRYVTAKHAPKAARPGADGWSRVRSTEGPFSIEIPGPVDDITRMENGQPGFMLRGVDKQGTVFMAVFERSGPDSQMGGTFDDSISKPDANKRMFKGAQALDTTGKATTPDGTRVTYGLWFRVPGGTYMLGVAPLKAHEAEARKLKERFFNSLVFE